MKLFNLTITFKRKCKHKKVEMAFIAHPKYKKVRGNAKPVIKYNIISIYRCKKCKVVTKEVKVKNDLSENEVMMFYKERNIDYAKV